MRLFRVTNSDYPRRDTGIIFPVMTTLVTGAFGCIGAWVVRGLLAAGERPVAFDLGGDPWRVRMIAGPDAPGRVVVVRGDITDREGLTHVEQPIPFPAALDDARYQKDLGPAPPTSLADGAAKTLDEFERLRKDGRLDSRELT